MSAPKLRPHAQAVLDCMDKAALHAGRLGGSGYALHYLEEAREHMAVVLAEMQAGIPQEISDSDSADTVVPISREAPKPSGNTGAKLDPPKPRKPSPAGVADFLNAFATAGGP